MVYADEVAQANARHWDRMVKENCGYTIPWLDLTPDLIRRIATGEETSSLGLRTVCSFASRIDVEDKDVLCIGSGGGQQSAVFGLLGARVVVVDFCEGQIAGDRKAAAYYGYDVTTVHADMRDLSSLADECFHIVYGTALVYVPDVRVVYRQVARVLRRGGLYRTDFHQPAIHAVDWDGGGYRITKAYSDRTNTRNDGAIEFRHYLDDIFNRLLEAGLTILRIDDLSRMMEPPSEAVPGSWAHQEPYVGGLFAVESRKG